MGLQLQLFGGVCALEPDSILFFRPFLAHHCNVLIFFFFTPHQYTTTIIIIVTGQHHGYIVTQMQFPCITPALIVLTDLLGQLTNLCAYVCVAFLMQPFGTTCNAPFFLRRGIERIPKKKELIITIENMKRKEIMVKNEDEQVKVDRVC